MTGDQQSVVSQRWFISALWVFVALCTVWLILVIWPDWLVQLLGRKKVFVNALLNGVTLGALYFLVASGFTLIFGLMRNVNLAHGCKTERQQSTWHSSVRSSLSISPHTLIHC